MCQIGASAIEVEFHEGVKRRISRRLVFALNFVGSRPSSSTAASRNRSSHSSVSSASSFSPERKRYSAESKMYSAASPESQSSSCQPPLKSLTSAPLVLVAVLVHQRPQLRDRQD